MKDVKINIWEKGIVTILDHDEASIVRENAMMLLTNLTSHTMIMNEGLSCFQTKKKSKNFLEVLLTLLTDYNFYKELEVILSCLYTNSTFNSESNQSEVSSFTGLYIIFE